MSRIGQRRRCAAQLFEQLPRRLAAVAPYVIPQLLALAVSATLVAAGWDATTDADAWTSGFLAIAFAGLRIAAIKADLVASTYVLDAVGVTVFIGGTGGAASPFFAIALAGAWWAGAKARRGSFYGLMFTASYLVLVAPQAVRDGELAAMIYQPAFVLAMGALADRGHENALSGERGPATFRGIAGAYRDSVKAGLSRVVGERAVAVDALAVAGQLGLTARQTELIPYLLLGLSNQEIADALSVSEATVRYHLTRLYRSLGVKGRKAAAERARELGLGGLLPATPPDST
jgi:DNA-binding CsgD family transcriptional regulator